MMSVAPGRSLTRNQHLLLNFIALQGAWFTTVMGAARQQWLPGLAITTVVLLLHLWLSRQPRRELLLLGCVLVLGGAWDSALAAQGVIVYAEQWLPSLAPVWILLVWAQFATALNVGLVFLRQRYLLAMLLGGLGAPLSFLGGQKLGALQFPDQPLALMVLAMGWALLMPILMWLAERFDGVSAVQVQDNSSGDRP